MNEEQIIQLLKDRLNLAKESYLNYKDFYELRMKKLDIEFATKYHRWMMQSYELVKELEYILELIEMKGDTQE